uniref:ATP synthase subunit b n=1 Tax=Candidatus Kentrum sp. SD TaxID=2126332 RepID=A0A450YDG4_9GAMM|nr:MAG: F-type H+-transporting ATPase subunit b [Candidatus Kentron sp. SD]VFK44952.1 MAG: F-type H+-transporting ATPase subunit b [Candidatus Kentron sp. SD]VFK80199.1 MAG: F-type H+-transporting ATPase subunit b [Candidatus Kentron sp. SD]
MNLTATLVGQIIVFGVLVWFIRRFLWEPVIHVLDDRKKRITDGLAAAEKGHREKELADRRAKEVIHNAREQASGIINQAHKRADEIIEESKENAHVEADRLLTVARSEREQEVNRVKEQLRKEVFGIALMGVEQVLMREVDRQAHGEVFEKLARKL